MARIKRDPNDIPIPEKVLSAAARLFTQLGFESTSMKAIADEANITPAALYYHFENKEELVYQTLQRAAQGLLDACQGAMADLPKNPERALLRFVESHVVFQLTNLETVALVYTALVHSLGRQRGVLSEERRAVLRDLETRHFRNLRRILTTGTREGVFDVKDPTITSFAIIGMCEHTTYWFRNDGRLSAPAAARQIAKLAVRTAKRPAAKDEADS